MAIRDFEKLIEMIVGCMQEQARQARTERAEVDISGGVDSAVVAALAVRAFGADKVIGVFSSLNSAQVFKERARAVARKFGFKMLELELTSAYQLIIEAVAAEFARLGLPFPAPEDPTARTIFGGLRSCLRAPVGRFVNRAFGGGIRQGTGNRDEDEFVRFYQKGGDGEVDCNWIEGLFKSEVWELAAYLGVPAEVINAAPSPDLWGQGEAHTDEQELAELTGVALTYTRPAGPMGTIEWASRENQKNGIIDGANAQIAPSALGYTASQSKIIEAVRHLERVSRHKAQLPPSLSREKLLAAQVIS